MKPKTSLKKIDRRPYTMLPEAMDVRRIDPGPINTFGNHAPQIRSNAPLQYMLPAFQS